MLSNDHENGAAILLTVREAKNKLETENGTLKRKIVEQEKEIESLGLESKQLKKQLVALSDRCTIAEG
jgi:predicted RNase H-like nuclease (RuvC/YqgF family)